MATTQNFNYPSSSDVTVTGIGNPIGQPYPSSAVPIAGDNPEGLLTPIAVTDGGAVITTPATGSLQNVNLTEVSGAAITEGQKASAASLPVVIASDQSTLPISAASLPLPTGASTSALQTTGNASLATIATNTTGVATAANQATQETTLSAIQANQTNGTQTTTVSNFPATQPISGTVTVTQATGTNLHTVVDASALPTGASTAALQSSTQGAIGGGTAATASTLAGGVYNPGQTTITSGQQIALQTDNLGRLQVVQNASVSTVSSIAVTGVATAIHQIALTVGTTAVRLTVSGATPALNRIVLVATPDSATASTVTFYIGSSTVTNSGSTRGIEIQQGQSFIANNDAGDYYIVASVAAQTVTIMEQY